MSSTARQLHYTYEQYRALEEEISVRHEYLDGEIYAMAGGSPDHAALAATVIRLLGAQLLPGAARSHRISEFGFRRPDSQRIPTLRLFAVVHCARQTMHWRSSIPCCSSK